jgi:hypothetical protein
VEGVRSDFRWKGSDPNGAMEQLAWDEISQTARNDAQTAVMTCPGAIQGKVEESALQDHWREYVVLRPYHSIHCLVGSIRYINVYHPPSVNCKSDLFSPTR